ncbi:hypothetical protein EVAR_11408_1 [Eumeta japonica]|uniref:Uncharacterized protein n=1 Tax=Eumeta variegata TaxID=151549 RepID=A0A4C1TKR9_EUMVA|nr:hypothetical protein EVAR_11408_1 [Eumeta japonica]
MELNYVASHCWPQTVGLPRAKCESVPRGAVVAWSRLRRHIYGAADARLAVTGGGAAPRRAAFTGLLSHLFNVNNPHLAASVPFNIDPRRKLELHI